MSRTSATLAMLLLAGCAMRPGPVTPPASDLQADQVNWQAAQTVEVALDEYHFAPEELAFKAGQPYRLVFSNSGSDAHNFTSPEFFSAVLLRPGQPGGAVAARGGQIELAPGASSTVELVPVTKGSFPFKCTHPFHNIFGMTGMTVIR